MAISMWKQRRALAVPIALVVIAAGIGVSFWALRVGAPAGTLLPERIAFFRAVTNHQPQFTFDILTVRPHGTDLRNVTNGMAAEGPVSWSMDGSTLAFVHQSAEEGTGSRGVYVMRVDGTGLREVVPCQSSYGRLPCDIRKIALSPDGRRLAFVANDRPWALDLIGTDGTGQREIACALCGLGIGHLAWSPDGTRLAFGADLASIIGGDIAPHLSPLYVADLRTGRVAKLPDVTTASPFPSWSPDGSRILLTWDRVSRQSPAGPILAHDIVAIDAEGTGWRTILSCAQANCSEPEAPVWSPDGTRLAFIDRRGSAWEIWIVAIDGRVLLRMRPCAVTPCFPDNLVWSPDGRRLAFQGLTEDHSSWDVYVVGADGRDVRLVEGTDGLLAWLPSFRPTGG